MSGYLARMRSIVVMLTLLLSASGLYVPKAEAINLDKFALDSIAAWGKFPNFCIRTYRWGDKFFNGYDTTYMEGTGYKFNLKAKTNSWLENHTFRFDNNAYQMNMHSYPSTSAGLWLTYMAVAVGYDLNVSDILGLERSSRKRFNFQFNCMLFAANLYLTNTNSRMKINQFGSVGETYRTNISFDDIHGKEWGLDTYYFFNHKHYSQSAAFFYSRLQRKSAGSLYAGISLSGQNYKYDFASLPPYLLSELPHTWPDYKYHIHAHNYAFKLGYGYNWVLSRHWLLGLSEAPSIGIRYGYVNDPASHRTSVYAFNRFKASLVYNNGHWFGGIVGQADTNLFSDNDNALITNNFSMEVSVGYRFNLW